MDNQPYRLTFGKHNSQSIHDIPSSYRTWLISQEIYAGKEDLKAALIEGKYLSAAAGTKSAPATPTKKRRVSDSESAIALPSSAKKLAISKEAKRNGTMLNYDGTTYILDFGKFAGMKLRDVPSTHIDWLITTNIHDRRPDLAAALYDGGLLPPDADSPEIADIKWKPPSPFATSDSRFYENLTHAPLWISDVDTSRYFRLGEPLLPSAGVHLVSEAELRRSVEFEELLSFFKGPKRWLYQVHACAERFGGAADADRALGEFLGKNRRREEEIWDEMGLTAWEGCM